MSRFTLRSAALVALVAVLLSGCTFLNFFGQPFGMIFAAAILTEFVIPSGTSSLLFLMALPFAFELAGLFRIYCSVSAPSGAPMPEKLRLTVEARNMDTGERLLRRRRTLRVDETGECRPGKLRIHKDFPANTELWASITPLGADLGADWTISFQTQYEPRGTRIGASGAGPAVSIQLEPTESGVFRLGESFAPVDR